MFKLSGYGPWGELSPRFRWYRIEIPDSVWATSLLDLLLPSNVNNKTKDEKQPPTTIRRSITSPSKSLFAKESLLEVSFLLRGKFNPDSFLRNMVKLSSGLALLVALVVPCSVAGTTMAGAPPLVNIPKAQGTCVLQPDWLPMVSFGIFSNHI